LFKDYTEGLAELAKEMGTRVFRGHIRDNTAIREAQAYGETIFDYSPKCNSAEDYTAFIKEFTSIIKRGKK
jgi:chromosome partitioning protein